MTTIVLVQTLGVEKVNVSHCCMCDLDAKIAPVDGLCIRNDGRPKICDILHGRY